MAILEDCHDCFGSFAFFEINISIFHFFVKVQPVEKYILSPVHRNISAFTLLQVSFLFLYWDSIQGWGGGQTVNISSEVKVEKVQVFGSQRNTQSI